MSDWSRFSNQENHRWTIGEIEESDIGFYIGRYTESDLTKKVHNHEFIQIYFIKSGTLRHVIDNEASLLVKGDMFIIPPEVRHYVECSGNNTVEFVSIGFMPGFIDFHHGDNTLLNKFLDFVIVDQVIRQGLQVKPRITFSNELFVQAELIINDMFAEFVQKKDGYLLYIKGQLIRLIVLLAREYISSNYYEKNKDKLQIYNRAILESIGYINENFTKELNIDAVSKKFMLSRTYFCDLFKKFTGKTFTEYVNDLRINHAKKLIEDTNLNITEIAFASGFNDAACFSRKFRELTSSSPSVYRKANHTKITANEKSTFGPVMP